MTFRHKHRCPLTPGQLLWLTRTQWVSKLDYKLLALYVEPNTTHKESRGGDCSGCFIILGFSGSVFRSYFISVTLADNSKQLAYTISFMNILNNVPFFFFPRPGVVVTFCFTLPHKSCKHVRCEWLQRKHRTAEQNSVESKFWLLRLFQNVGRIKNPT